MVRLKVEKTSFPVASFALFQFLNGAIKRDTWTTSGATQMEFQFLNGAIKRINVEKVGLEVSSFQFLNGAIKRKKRFALLLSILSISIPKWCD